MGVFYVPVEVGSPNSQSTVTVEAMVDTGAIYSMMPASLLLKMGLAPGEVITFDVASGEQIDYPTNWATFLVDGRQGMARVIFGPEGEFLLGATTLEDLRLMVDPVDRRLVPTRAPLL